MNIVTRDTTESDLIDIFGIRSHPLVQPHQHKLSRQDTIEVWKEQLFGELENEHMVFKCTTILRHNTVIGHISQFHFEVHNQRTCYCGWNLDPAYWGQGIALFALSQLFDRFFSDRQIDTVISDCFSNNQRCIRVLQKLNYEPASIAFYERLQTLVVYRCFHWIRRFQLTADRWHARLQTIEK